MPKIQRALLSVSDKTGLVELAQQLVELNVELLASGGTAAALQKAGCKVTEVSDYTGAPEVLDGRVKTLHPKIHAGILARRASKDHCADLDRIKAGPIDLVVVNLYPFESTIAKSGTTFEDAVEQIDIGGPTLLRAAAKNYQDVVALSDPADYTTFIEALAAGQGTVEVDFARKMARKVFARVAAYDAAISNYWHETGGADEQFPEVLTAQYRKLQGLRYGENPHQQAAWYQAVGEEPLIGNSLQGKELSYNNLLDVDGAIHLAHDLRDYPYAVAILKHGNPCGVGISETSLLEAFERAKSGDPISAFGGIIATNQPIDRETAEAITKTFFEVICAPSFDDKVRSIFAAKKNLRLIPFDLERVEAMNVRGVCGGRLMQSVDTGADDMSTWRVATKREPTPDERQALQLAWRVCKNVRSNAIIFTAQQQTIGIGAGQMSRLDSVKLAHMKMQDITIPGDAVHVAASDAFFPFRDGVDALASAGVTAVVQPGGSVKDEEVIAAADEHNLAMLCTGVRHFKH